MQSPDPELRYQALAALWSQQPTPDGAASCLTALQDVDSAVKAAAARFLGVSIDRNEPLESLAPTAIERLLTLLGDDDPDVRFECSRTLVKLGCVDAPILAALTDLFDDSDAHPALIAAIAELFSQFPADRALAPQRLVAALMHPAADVRTAAARSLAAFPETAASAQPRLIELLDDEDPYMREAAAVALGACPALDAATLLALKTACDDEDDVVAQTATAALAAHTH